MANFQSLDPDTHGFHATFFSPAQPSGAGVLVVGGSGGNPAIVERFADALAAAGHAALALSYFGAPGLPDELVEIPLETFRNAARWLADRPEVDAQRVVMLGASRGAEAALLAGSVFEEIHGVIATAPAHVVFQGLAARRGRPRSAWTIGGVPLPFVPFRTPLKALFKLWRGDDSALRDIHAASLRARHKVADALIPVERIRGPVLLISGGDDRLWPAGEMAEAVRLRLAAADFRFPVRHVHYSDAGHIVCSPWPVPDTVSIGQRTMRHGGTTEGNRAAQADAWQHVLDYLAVSDPWG